MDSVPSDSKNSNSLFDQVTCDKENNSKVSLHAYVTLLMWRNPTTGLHKKTKNGVQSYVHGQVNV